MPAKIIPGRSKKPTGTKGKNNMIKTTKIIESTTAKMKTDGINITSTTAKITNPKYAAIYPLRLVTCLPFMVKVVLVKKLITDTSSNMPITINRIFFLFIDITSVSILTNAWVSQLLLCNAVCTMKTLPVSEQVICRKILPETSLEPEDIQSIAKAFMEMLKPVLSVNGKLEAKDIIFDKKGLTEYLRVSEHRQ